MLATCHVVVGWDRPYLADEAIGLVRHHEVLARWVQGEELCGRAIKGGYILGGW